MIDEKFDQLLCLIGTFCYQSKSQQIDRFKSLSFEKQIEKIRSSNTHAQTSLRLNEIMTIIWRPPSS